MSPRTESGGVVQEPHATSGPTTFEVVADVADLERLVERSEEAPVVLFLHDPGCPISQRAAWEMGQLGETVAVVDVRHGRHVSRTIAALTEIQHESPQVIVLRHGQAVWSASHYGVTAEAVAAAVGTGW